MTFDYDLFVIGAGSGGLAASKLMPQLPFILQQQGMPDVKLNVSAA